MNLSTWSTFFISSIFIMIAASASFSTKDYVNLISDLYNLHKASFLTSIHFIDRKDVSQMDTIFNIQILLSRARIMTVTLNLEEGFLPNDYTKSLRYVKKPMTVIFITCESDVNKMKELSKEPSFYGVTNLIVFMKAFKSPLIKSCMNPVGNPFLLSESFSFFVKCYEDFGVREWHALNRNQLAIRERVTCKPTSGLGLKSKKLMQSVNNILNGKVLRIERLSIHYTFHTYLNDLSLVLELAGNFTTKNVEIEENADIGFWNTSSKTWSGAMGRIENNEIDIIDFVGQDARLSLLADSTMYITLFEVCLCIRKPTSEVGVLWSGYFKPFTYKTWCALTVSLIVLVTLLTFLRFKVENGSYHGGISQNFLHVWRCYVQQGLPEFPKTLALRLFYYSIFLFGFSIFAIYSAAFVSQLTILQENLPFKSMEEFLKDRSYRLAAPSLYDINPTDPIWIGMKKKLMQRNQSPRNDQDALNLICSENIALLETDISLSILSVNAKIPCNLVKIDLQIYLAYRMYLPKNSPYKEAINYHITKLKENGILKRIESKLQGSSGSRISSINTPTEQKYQPVTVLDIASLLAMFCGSLVLSILILFFEKVYFTVLQRKSVKISTHTRPGAARIRISN